MTALRVVNATVDDAQVFQAIDGFGVNITSKYLDDAQRQEVLDLLVNDLGASLFRVDIWGKSNWLDPENLYDARLLDVARYEEAYQHPVFQRGWALLRDLQQRGVEYYLTASGCVSSWMTAADGETLADYESWAEMMVSLLKWAVERENLRFRYFSPLNETDLGPPEGPRALPEDLTHAIEALCRQMGSLDIRLSIADQNQFNTAYLAPLLQRSDLMQRIGVIGMHTYGHLSLEEYQDIVDYITQSSYPDVRVWMTEFGDLDQTGEREWYVAWSMTERLFRILQAGFQAALAWDAYDNYHDHDEAWTIYGLLRTGLRQFTPKRRYYGLKQIYRFVRPGFQRVHIIGDDPQVVLLAFVDQAHQRLTIVGMNHNPFGVILSIKGANSKWSGQIASYYRTNSSENCVHVADVPFWNSDNYPLHGLTVEVEAESIFTLTNVGAVGS